MLKGQIVLYTLTGGDALAGSRAKGAMFQQGMLDPANAGPTLEAMGDCPLLVFAEKGGYISGTLLLPGGGAIWIQQAPKDKFGGKTAGHWRPIGG